MSIKERDIVLQGRDGGEDTIDLPITRLGNIESGAKIKEEPAQGDYIPIIDATDSEQMKKFPAKVLTDAAETAERALKAVQRVAYVIDTLPYQTAALTFTGEEQSPAWGAFDPEKLEISGDTSAVNAGEYEAVFTPKGDYVWTDESVEPRTVKWSIGRAAVAAPSVTGSLTYTGAVQSPAWTGYDADKLELGGDTSATNAGSYEAVFTPKANYQWADGTAGAKTVGWTIAKAAVAVPSQSGSLTYTGVEQSPAWTGYDTDKMEIGGDVSGVNAGSYTATFLPKENYMWSDGTVTAKAVSWAIGKAVISAVPTQSGARTYNGSAQSPEWANYDPNKLTLGGTTSGINAGSYTAAFTPTVNYQWGDGTTGAKAVSWAIGKAAGSLALDKNAMELSFVAVTGTITVIRAGTGTITAFSSNPNVAAVAVNGNVVTVTAKANGAATITVSVGADNNYTQVSGNCAVTAMWPSTTLANNTPEMIRQVARAGMASNYWRVGDMIGIALNGTVGTLTFNNTYYAFIIGFNHNSSREGGNSIHFQFGKTSAGVDIAFCDGDFGNYDGSAGFRMNTTPINEGGWRDSYMRNTICPAFLSAMPAAWQNVIAACTKYSDNTGGGSDGELNNASCITGTSDKIWLLSEFEVRGTRTCANSAEPSYQVQYDYYKNGNSGIKYQHGNPSSVCIWWTRSIDVNRYNRFASITTDGTILAREARYSNGFAPGFKVA